MTPRAALQSGTWHLESLNGKSLSGSMATLDFEKNRFHAKICNTMNGGYGVFRDRLMFRRVISTMMYCEGDIMNVENAMNFTWAKFMVGSDTLTITTKKGDVIVWKKK
jgi:heat shock protein HslJ